MEMANVAHSEQTAAFQTRVGAADSCKHCSPNSLARRTVAALLTQGRQWHNQPHISRPGSLPSLVPLTSHLLTIKLTGHWSVKLLYHS